MEKQLTNKDFQSLVNSASQKHNTPPKQGLDYELLKKTKEEIKQKDILSELDEIIQQPKQHTIEKPKKQSTPLFKTHVARNVYKFLQQPRPLQETDLFLPKRMTFVYRLDEHTGFNVVPTIKLRAKEDCPLEEERMKPWVPNDVIENLQRLMVQIGNKSRKKKKQEKPFMRPKFGPQPPPKVQSSSIEQQTVVEKKEVEVDDIFAGVPEYKCVPKKKPSKSKEKKSSFEKIEIIEASKEEIVKKPEPPKPQEKKLTQQDFDRGVATVFRRDPVGVKVEPFKSKEATYIPDEYAECYPGTFEAGFDRVAYTEDGEELTIAQRERKRFWYDDIGKSSKRRSSSGYKPKKRKSDKYYDKEWEKIQDIIKRKAENPSSEPPKKKGKKY